MVVMMFSNDAWGALALLGGGESEKRRHTYMIVQYQIQLLSLRM